MTVLPANVDRDETFSAIKISVSVMHIGYRIPSFLFSVPH